MADSFSEHFKTMHGTFRNPAKTDALRRRSPATSSYSAAEIFLTDNGCKIPFSLIDAERAASSVSSEGFARLCFVRSDFNNRNL